MAHSDVFRKIARDSRKAISWLSVSDLKAVSSPTPQQLKDLKKCRRAYLNGLHRIENHKTANRLEAMRKAQASHLAARSVKVTNVLRAAYRKGLRLSFEKIEQIAAGLDAQKLCFEQSHITLKQKEVGGKRAVSRFGIEATARQYIAADLLAAKIVGNPFEYARAGRGPKAISAAIKGAIHEGNFYWIECDVVSCFASLKPCHFETLPLPVAIKRDILSNKRAKPGIKPDMLSLEDWALIQAARHTLPQGAASSPIVASAFLGRELRPLKANAKVALFTYSDNIIIGARCLEEAKAFAEALKEHFQSLHAGPLTIKIGECHDVRHRADILGWRFKLRYVNEEPRVSRCPRQRSFYRFEKLFAVSTYGPDLRL